MSDNLATLIDKVQAILSDTAGTYFSDATVTAAIRQALSDWNQRAPVHAAVIITGIANQYEYELTDEDADAYEIIDVLSQGTNNNEMDVSLEFDAYIEDERIFFRLRRPVTASNTLIVRYTIHHTINGLDGETTSTLRSQDDQAIVVGGAFFSIIIRATGRIETINLSQDQSDNYREVAGMYAAAFAQRLAQAARSRRAPVGEPITHAWEDNYHSWEQ